MKVRGQLIDVLEAVQITDKFKKRSFVVEYAENTQYPQTIQFELIQDKCGIIDNYAIGEIIDVEFNLNGRKWEKDGETKYFNTLQAWRISKAESQPQADAPVNEYLGDDLPF